jgi:hypothetical protein
VGDEALSIVVRVVLVGIELDIPVRAISGAAPGFKTR